MCFRGSVRVSSCNILSLSLLSLFVLGTAGCNLNQTATLSSAPTPKAAPLQGRLFGGQQPVAGAAIQLYAVGTPVSGGGYGLGSTPLITGTLPLSDINGNFTITGNYTPPAAASHFYIVATGGSPGFGNPVNPNLVLMSALGACTATHGLSPSLYININEVTTMASVLALQPFMAPPAAGNKLAPAIGAPSTAYNSLQNAFETVNNLVNTSAGSVVLPVNDWATSMSNGLKGNTLGDILASCINSNPALDNSCSTLFTDATPTGSSYLAADPVQAAYYIAQNPSNNVSALFNLVPASPPFVGLSSVPADYSYAVATSAVACQAPITLGSASNFAVLATSTVTNTGNTVITGGNLGLYPGNSVTGFSPPGTLTPPATMHVNDVTAQTAEGDLQTAYTTTMNLPGGAVLPADLSGLVLTPSLYSTVTTALISTSLTLDAQGDPDAVFIFQIGTALTVAAGAQLNLINGAQAGNVFWETGTAATLQAGATFSGVIMSGTSVTLAAGSTLTGRALATNGAVTFSTNTLTTP